MSNVALRFTIEKASPTGEFASGWFNVVDKDGKRVEDTQGDLISIGEIKKAAHLFIGGARVVKLNHGGGQVGEVVESVLIDDDFAKAHGIAHGKRGWWGTTRFTDDAVKKMVREGKLKGYSIGGKGKRTEIKKTGPTASEVHSDAPLGSRPRSTKHKLKNGRVRFTLARYRSARRSAY